MATNGRQVKMSVETQMNLPAKLLRSSREITLTWLISDSMCLISSRIASLTSAVIVRPDTESYALVHVMTRLPAVLWALEKAKAKPIAKREPTSFAVVRLRSLVVPTTPISGSST